MLWSYMQKTLENPQKPLVVNASSLQGTTESALGTWHRECDNTTSGSSPCSLCPSLPGPAPRGMNRPQDPSISQPSCRSTPTAPRLWPLVPLEPDRPLALVTPLSVSSPSVSLSGSWASNVDFVIKCWSILTVSLMPSELLLLRSVPFGWVSSVTVDTPVTPELPS